MNRFRTSLLLAGLLLAAAAVAGVAQPRFAHGAASQAARTITVTGNGAVSAVPDRAAFDFGVTTRAATAKDALARNSAAATAVIAALKSAGVAAADLQTTGVSLSPQTSPDGTTIVGYSASNSVSARIALAKAGGIVDAAVGAGADSVSGPGLDRSDQSTLYTQALKQALTDAQTKAQTLADASRLKLGAVQTIDESSASVPVPFGAKAAVAGSVPIEPGTQEIDATVTVTYAAG
jgi:uncharacterized protein